MDAKIAAVSNSRKTNWDDQLTLVTFNYNTSIHSSTKQVPFEMMYGRKPVLPFNHQDINVTLDYDTEHKKKLNQYSNNNRRKKKKKDTLLKKIGFHIKYQISYIKITCRLHLPFELRQWLNKRLTCQAFKIGLDPELRRLNPHEFQYRKSLYTYAANDCDAINQIIMHSNIINNQYREITPVNELNHGVLFNEVINEPGGSGIDDEVVLDDEGHAIMIDESSPIINSTIKSTTTLTIINNEPYLLEPISSDEEEEPINTEAEPTNFDRLTQVNPEPCAELTPTNESTQLNFEPRAESILNNERPVEPRRPNPLSQEQRKKIHNRSRTIRQRKKAYTYEFIIRNIEKRFPIRTMKQILQKYGIPVTQVKPLTSNRTRETILWVGVKNPEQIKKYETITRKLFSKQHYHQLFHLKQRRHRHNRSQSRASENKRRHYHHSVEKTEKIQIT